MSAQAIQANLKPNESKHFHQKSPPLVLRHPRPCPGASLPCRLNIQAIELEHFGGKPVSGHNADYSDSVIRYFQGEVRKQLKIIEVRLREFRSFNTVVPVSEETIQKKASNIYYPDAADKPTLIIEKLRFIDEITGRYGRGLSKQSVALVPLNGPEAPQTNGDRPDNKPKVETVSDKTGLVPRSIMRTFSRIQRRSIPSPTKQKQKSSQNFGDRATKPLFRFDFSSPSSLCPCWCISSQKLRLRLSWRSIFSQRQARRCL